MSVCGEIENIEFETKQLLKILADKKAYLRRLKQIEKGDKELVDYKCYLTERDKAQAETVDWADKMREELEGCGLSSDQVYIVEVAFRRGVHYAERRENYD
jgi:hypothetical protein|tara:strand:- start:1516 stop:1818 length:303 start_codon:yes stop_codon:yes gene_type:complete